MNLIFWNRYPSDEEWAASWEKRIKDYDALYKRKEGDLLCSLHFAKASMDPVSRQLVDHALPVYFPRFNGGLPNQQRILPMKLTAVSSTSITTTTTATTDGIKSSKLIPSHSISQTDSRCCINGCPTRFDETDSNIPGFKWVKISIHTHSNIRDKICLKAKYPNSFIIDVQIKAVKHFSFIIM